MNRFDGMHSGVFTHKEFDCSTYCPGLYHRLLGLDLAKLLESLRGQVLDDVVALDAEIPLLFGRGRGVQSLVLHDDQPGLFVGELENDGGGRALTLKHVSTAVAWVGIRSI